MEVSPVGKNSSLSSFCHSVCSAARGLNLMSLLTLKRRSPSASGGRAARYSGCWKRAASGAALGPPPLQPRQQVDHDVHGAGDEEHHEDQHPELADQEHFHGRGG